jgi:hypothetical protein
MLKRLALVGLVFSTVVIFPSHAQKSTEIFIPIGKSPGISGKYSVIGYIASFDETTRALTIKVDDVEHAVTITEETEIWLDKSEVQQTNEVGSPADCRQGRLCEMKYVYDGETRTDEAEWLKIRVGESD